MLRLVIIPVVGLLLGSSPLFAEQAKPSFDCSKAAAADEKAICADPKLAAIDVVINDGYRRMVAKLGRATANSIHAPYLRRRHACGSKAACIMETGKLELPIFKLADPSISIPADMEANPPKQDYDALKHMLKTRECTLSTITLLGPRLCSADASGNCPENLPFDDTGNAITAKNEVYGVSYDRLKPLEQSKLGDVVLLCLKSIPSDCPKDDDRGYDWNWRDLRTKGHWDLPDSEHMCGGA